MGTAVHKPAGISILNDVLGPVMRGPSSSHTAASYHLGRLAAALLGAPPAEIRVAFDPAGSYGQVYRQQGVDRGFAMGILGLPLTDERYFTALEEAAGRGIRLVFEIVPLRDPDHPNCTDISLHSLGGRNMDVRARSIGGGAVEITRIDGWPVLLTGQTYDVVIECAGEAASHIRSGLEQEGGLIGEPEVQSRGGRVLLHFRRGRALEPDFRAAMEGLPEVAWLRESPPIGFVKQGRPLFQSAAELIALSAGHQGSIARAGLAHEAGLLGISERQVFEEMARRVDLMCAAVHAGLGEHTPPMQLLTPTAGLIYRADAEGRLAIGGMHTRAAARALAVMHMNSGMGVVCAAPTGGSAGVLPGVLATLMEERGLDRRRAAMAAMAAGAIGVVVAARATFAAEIAGCQVEDRKSVV
jgi:L-serine dehydratase